LGLISQSQAIIVPLRQGFAMTPATCALLDAISASVPTHRSGDEFEALGLTSFRSMDDCEDYPE